MHHWFLHTNLYEVNVRQYTKEGTLAAFLPHLERLAGMGVDTLWFMPLTPISKEKMKGSLGSYYACSDYHSISPEFGTEEDFKNVVKKAHALGMKVIIDWVANHTGWDHEWTKQHPEWFKRDAAGDFVPASGMEDIIELDFSNPVMRSAMIAAMQSWVDRFEIDGFRCDLAFWVPVDFWKEAIPSISSKKPLFWLAEMEAAKHPEYMEVFHAAYAWDWMHATEKWYRETLPLSFLKEVLAHYELVPGVRTWFTSNHDENSWNGTEYEKYGKAAMLLAIHSFTWPGIPLLYSGQELPLQKRLAFFDRDPIDWGPLQMESFYSRLLHLQKAHPALHAKAQLFLIPSSSPHLLAYLRKEGDEEVLVLLNASSHAIQFQLKADWVSGLFRDVLNDEEIRIEKNMDWRMEAWEGRVSVRGKVGDS